MQNMHTQRVKPECFRIIKERNQKQKKLILTCMEVKRGLEMLQILTQDNDCKCYIPMCLL